MSVVIIIMKIGWITTRDQNNKNLDSFVQKKNHVPHATYYCAPLGVSEEIESIAVWRHYKPKPKHDLEKIQDQLEASFLIFLTLGLKNKATHTPHFWKLWLTAKWSWYRHGCHHCISTAPAPSNIAPFRRKWLKRTHKLWRTKPPDKKECNWKGLEDESFPVTVVPVGQVWYRQRACTNCLRLCQTCLTGTGTLPVPNQSHPSKVSTWPSLGCFFKALRVTVTFLLKTDSGYPKLLSFLVFEDPTQSLD